MLATEKPANIMMAYRCCLGMGGSHSAILLMGAKNRFILCPFVCWKPKFYIITKRKDEADALLAHSKPDLYHGCLHQTKAFAIKEPLCASLCRFFIQRRYCLVTSSAVIRLIQLMVELLIKRSDYLLVSPVKQVAYPILQVW